jgi:two-component system, OmpR family, response regulator
MRILLVEDEPKIAAALKRGLAQESYAVDLVDNADDGLDAALSGEHDMVILDRMLPGAFDGLEICRQMRVHGLNIPVIMLTAKDKIGDRVIGLDAGADDYLVKPFAFEELLARIRALLRRPAEAMSDVLVAGDLTYDTASRKVIRAGAVVGLSAREQALLEYLMRNQGRVLSKDQIIAHVWDFDADVLPNTLEVYIGYLRNKLERPFGGRPLIHTLRGVGYKLEAYSSGEVAPHEAPA